MIETIVLMTTLTALLFGTAVYKLYGPRFLYDAIRAYLSDKVLAIKLTAKAFLKSVQWPRYR